MTRPFEALEGARLDRIEFEKRTAQEKAQQRRMEKEQKAKQASEKRGDAAAKHAPDADRAGRSRALRKAILLETIPPSPDCPMPL
jgi:hypothetical protein